MSDDFSSEERQLLHAMQAADSPSSEEQLRVKQKLFAQLGLGVVAASSAGLGFGAAKAVAKHVPESVMAPAVGSSAAGLLTSTGLKLALGIATVLSVGAGATYLLLGTGAGPAKGPDPVNQATVAPVATAASVAEPKANVPSEAQEPSLADSPSRAVAPVAPASSARKSGLQRETELLSQAQQAIGAGRAREALSLLTEHQKQFPRGTLRIERQATLALARCLAGERERGRVEAEAFRRQHPNSPMNQRLADACGLQSNARSPNKP